MKERGTLLIESRSAAEHKIEVRISDDGIGIEEADKARIFDPFFTTKHERGTGFGLTIARQIVEGHGGQIEFMSKRGKGSTFFVLLPAPKVTRRR